MDGRGNAYLNNIGFDMMGGEKVADGILAVVTPDSSVRQAAGGVSFPNGMAVTPDNSSLILAESYGKRLTTFDIEGVGGLSNSWATASRTAFARCGRSGLVGGRPQQTMRPGSRRW